ncbi:MAG: hypothetical protein K9L56_15440 [Clostridiales bacterium]|nr:hypothetical protein [Clostridiales bacterium]
MERKWEDDEVREDGVVKDKAWSAIVAGFCGFGALLVIGIAILLEVL